MSRLLHEGQRIGRSYEVERYLGEGAFAQVYRVRHRYLGRLAMKVFKHVGTAEETERLLGEAIMLSQLSHPNIVRIFDADTVSTPAGECGFFTMEYVAGGTLHDFWTSHQDRFVPVTSVVEVVRQVCDGLSVAHRERPPIVHRDLTLQNILVGYDGDGLRARISDFGLAKRANPADWMVSAQGTLVFKAPESLRNPQSDSTAGDIWALGTIIYLLLTDTLPFEDPGGAQSFIGAHIREPPRSPQAFNVDVDDALAEVVVDALQPDPRRRIRDAPAMQAALARWQEQYRAPDAPSPDAPMAPAASCKPPRRTEQSEVTGLVEQALLLTRQVGTLPDAADLMEEAFNKDPRLRSRYGSRVALWRKGVMS